LQAEEQQQTERNKVKQHGTIQLAGLFLAVLPTIVFGGESARLTIGGYVPPMQRVAAVQSSAAGNGETVIVLREQNNSALGYTLTVESKTLDGQTNTAAALQINFGDRPINLTNNKPKLPRTLNRPGGQTIAKVLEVLPSPNSFRDAILLTIASQ
jgi:hypothetical protein